MKSRQWEDVVRTVRSIGGASDLPELERLVRDVARPFGYDRFVLYSADVATDDVVGHIFWLEGDWFADGTEVDTRTYLARCPITRHLLEEDEPFYWSKTSYAGGATYRVVPTPTGPGVHGLQVPVFGPPGLVGAMSYGGEDVDSSDSSRLAMVVVGNAALRRAQRVAAAGLGGVESHLTSREREVVRWLASGQKQSDVALLMGLSERTVENHLRRIRKRLGARTTAQAILMAARAGVV